MFKLTLKDVAKEQREEFVPYLLIGDEDEKIVRSYLYDGELFGIYYGDATIGAVLCIIEKKTVEIKNIALISAVRRSGFGKEVMQQLLPYYKKKQMKKVIVGTANSSIDNIAFYQKVGFRMCEIKRDYFAAYEEPIVENGIRAIDMVIFERCIEDNV